MFGFLNVNKPAGPTSHDVVDRVRELLRSPGHGRGRSVRTGHAGTLDPLADGVLVVCLGPATRLAEYVQQLPKRYTVEVALGATSTTDDPEGRIVQTPNCAPSTEAEVRGALLKFVGRIDQAPPAHSAVHVAGQRAYTLARAGRALELPARSVSIGRIDLVCYRYPRLQLDVQCAGGTYIRSLARDVGLALGVGGYCAKLTRSQVGPFELASAVAIQDLDPAHDLLDPLLALADMPKIRLHPNDVARLALGQSVELEGAQVNPPADGPAELAVLGPRGELVAIAATTPDGRHLRPRKVFTR